MKTATNNPRMKSYVGTVRQLTEEEKSYEAYERHRRYLNDIATYEQYIADRDATIAQLTAALEQEKRSNNEFRT